MTEDLHSLAAAYVLDALDDDERRRFEAHLAECAECAVDVVDLRDAAEMLAAAEPVIAPPAGLKSDVLARIAATPQVPVEQAPDGVSKGSVDTTPTPPPKVAAPDRRTGPPAWITLAAAAVVVVVLGVGAVIAFGGDDDPPPDPTELAVDQVREAPDAVTVEMQGDGPGTVTVTYSEAEQRAVLVAEGLDEPGPDLTYQLWTISGDEPTPSVVFTPEGGELSEQVTMASSPPDAWAITVEPTGGSTSPTGSILFQGSPA